MPFPKEGARHQAARGMVFGAVDERVDLMTPVVRRAFSTSPRTPRRPLEPRVHAVYPEGPGSPLFRLSDWRIGFDFQRASPFELAPKGKS